ncbi:NRDE family protein [Acidocella sp.]|uniref:NRDE family protein n=2 Tax=Acidocella sp. TaxID=50710 RepID=UPI00261C1803|nr:NRDE family protein [Acidocella sp.]
MCTVVIGVMDGVVEIAANRDEMTSRPWQPPGRYWPGIIGGRDEVAGGTWAALNRFGVFASVLNREGTLGPEPGKRSRGELPLLALAHDSAEAATAAIAALEAADYRPFNMVIADGAGAFFLRGLGQGRPQAARLHAGVHMVTAGELDDVGMERIGRHLPRFRAESPAGWAALLADRGGMRAGQINIVPTQNAGFGTVSAVRVTLGAAGARFLFAAGAPHQAPFVPVDLAWDDV